MTSASRNRRRRVSILVEDADTALIVDTSPDFRQQMLDAFYTDTEVWKGQIIAQARQSLFQAVDGLIS